MSIRFQATPYTIGSWLVLPLPQKASAQLSSRSQVMVKGVLNGVPFQAPLEPDGNGNHWLAITKSLRGAAHVTAGDSVEVELEQTKTWPEPVIPADVAKALTHDSAAKAAWQDTTPMARWEWLRWIASTSQPETRKRRIEASCSKLRSGWRRPCCFNRAMCCIPEVSKNGVLLGP